MNDREFLLNIGAFLLVLFLASYANYRLDKIESQFLELQYEVHSFENQQTHGQWDWPRK